MIAAKNGKIDPCKFLYIAGADPEVDYFSTNAESLANEYAIEKAKSAQTEQEKIEALQYPMFIWRMLMHNDKYRKSLKPYIQQLEQKLVEEYVGYEELEEEQEKKL